MTELAADFLSSPCFTSGVGFTRLRCTRRCYRRTTHKLGNHTGGETIQCWDSKLQLLRGKSSRQKYHKYVRAQPWI